MTENDFRVGSVVRYTIPAEGPAEATVVRIGEEDGSLVVDLNDDHWARLDQLDRVVKY
jgi:hypothetical protein